MQTAQLVITLGLLVVTAMYAITTYFMLQESRLHRLLQYEPRLVLNQMHRHGAGWAINLANIGRGEATTTVIRYRFSGDRWREIENTIVLGTPPEGSTRVRTAVPVSGPSPDDLAAAATFTCDFVYQGETGMRHRVARHYVWDANGKSFRGADAYASWLDNRLQRWILRRRWALRRAGRK